MANHIKFLTQFGFGYNMPEIIMALFHVEQNFKKASYFLETKMF